jgi:hypothetical protein
VKDLNKRTLFNLCEYFELISNRKPELTASDFIEAMVSNEKVPSVGRLATSLFNNYLDRGQSGSIDFPKFLQRLYPHLSPAQLALARQWTLQYNQTFSCEVRRTRQRSEKV